MNRFQTLRLFVLMTLRGREVPLQDLVIEYGMEEELLGEIVHLNERESRRDREWNTLFLEWEQHMHLTPIYDPASGWFNMENGYEEHYDMEEVYDGPLDLQFKMDRAKRRVNRLFVALKKLQEILNPADKGEGIPF